MKQILAVYGYCNFRRRTRVLFRVFSYLRSRQTYLKAGLAKFIRSVTQFSGGRMARNLAQA